MNLALSALIILLLLLPAVFFRLGISVVSGHQRQNTNTKKSNEQFSAESIRYNFGKLLAKLTFTDTIFFFSVVPLLLHLISLCILWLCDANVDYAMLLNIFAGKADVIPTTGNNIFAVELLHFLTYCSAETGIAFLLGWLLTRIILKKPDKMLSLLVGENIWFKLFTGMMLSDELKRKADATMVEILCNTKETTVIYTGFLQKFDLAPHTNEISYITLKSAKRRDLRSALIVAQETADPVKRMNAYSNDYGTMLEIPGKFFTVMGKEIININVTYLELVTGTDGTRKLKEIS